MAQSYSWLFLAICATLLLLISSATTAEAGGAGTPPGMEMTWMPSIAMEGAEEEFMLDNEINQRMLASTRYISYCAIQRGSVPCSRRGASYYHWNLALRPTLTIVAACSAITRCRH